MADKKLLRKIAPIIMSAAVAMTSSPVGVMAEDFTSGEVSVEVSDETIYDSDEISDDYDESSEADDSADFGTDTEDGFESGEAAEEESGFEDGETGDTEDAFLANTEGETNNEAGAVKTVEDGQIVLMNIPYEAFYRSELKNNDVKVDAFTSATKAKTKMSGVMNNFPGIGNRFRSFRTSGSPGSSRFFDLLVTGRSSLRGCFLCLLI